MLKTLYLCKFINNFKLVIQQNIMVTRNCIQEMNYLRLNECKVLLTLMA